MASTAIPTLPTVMLLLLAVVLTFPSGGGAVSSREYEEMQHVLRSRGYNLICNAMATSDIQYELLTLPTNVSVTIFAPTDASLVATDMVLTASSYTDTLRLHMVPGLRLSLADLRSLSSGSILPTLLPSAALRLSTRPLSLSGIELIAPGLFYSRLLAVHGLAALVPLSSSVSYDSPHAASGPISGNYDDVVPLASGSNSTIADLSPPAATNPLTTADSNSTGLSPAASPSTEEISRSLLLISPVATTTPDRVTSMSVETPVESSTSSADSGLQRARSLLMEESNSDDSEVSEKSPSFMFVKAVNAKVKKCGAFDEIRIDCFVNEDGTGLDQLGVNHHVVRVMA